MSLTFTLKELTRPPGLNKYSAVHFLKKEDTEFQEGQKELLEKEWQINKKRIFKQFQEKMLLYFQSSENFYLLIPPTERNRFTELLRQDILNKWGNCIDLTGHFSKEQGVSFGTPPYSQMEIDELANYITISEDLKLDDSVKKILIADDVYSSGKTVDTVELKIRQIKSGVEIIAGTLVKFRN